MAHYIPILKGKRGEFDALASIPDAARASVTPLIELVPVPYDWETERPSKSVEDHAQNCAELVAKKWDGEHPIWVDPLLLRGQGGEALNRFFGHIEISSRNWIPVGGLARPLDQLAAIKQIAAEQGTGLVLRLDPQDLVESSVVKSRVNSWLTLMDSDCSEVDLVVDQEFVDEQRVPQYATMLKQFFKDLPYIHDWRSLTLASGAFPDSLAGRQNVLLTFPRTDLKLWSEVTKSSLPRTPNFGDYGISHPVLPAFDPRFIQPSAAIRFTGKTDWAVFKEAGIKKGFQQFNTASQRLIESEYWAGPEHCEGCTSIAACSNGGPTGNLTTWRRIGTTHHIIQTAQQFATDHV